jgi:transposase-like protein
MGSSDDWCMTKRRLSIPKLIERVPDENAAYEFMETLRWPDGPVCPHCGATKAYFLKPRADSGRKTRTGSVSARRVWKCASCRRQFSVITGTIFHGTKVSLRTWILVVFEMVSSKNGVSAREVERKYEVDTKTAWYMLHRIRKAMERPAFAGMFRGVVIADETFIGGSEKNRHAKDRHIREIGKGHAETKTAVFSLLDKDTGEVRSQIVPNVTGATLRKAIEQHVDPVGSELHTDKWAGYLPVGRQFDHHYSVDHRAEEYVRGDVTTNHIEGFFSQLKRSLDGTHHHVSEEHLPRYLAEFDFRYTTRHLDDTRRMERLFGQVGGRRLSYRPLTGD